MAIYGLAWHVHKCLNRFKLGKNGSFGNAHVYCITEERAQPDLGGIAMSKTSYEGALDKEIQYSNEEQEQGLLAQARASHGFGTPPCFSCPRLLTEIWLQARLVSAELPYLARYSFGT